MKHKSFIKGFVFCIFMVCTFKIPFFCQEIVKKANFQLANNWTVQKQYKRTENIWTIPSWVKGAELFAYKHVKNNVYNYFLIDCQKRSKVELFNRKKLCRLLEAELNTILNWERLNLSGFKISSKLNSVIFHYDNNEYEYNPTNNSLVHIERPNIHKKGGELIKSPDGKKSVLIIDNNLYYSSNTQSEREEMQIIQKGQKNYELYPHSIHWSPNSRYIAFLREDWRDVEDLWLINHYKDPRPTLETYKWPMPGEQIEQYELWVYDTKEYDLFKIKTEKWKDQTLDQIQWNPDSETIYFQRLSRDWKSLDLCYANPTNGESKELIKERNKRQVITGSPQYLGAEHCPYHILNTTGEIIWWSWRDGWNHFYLYDKNGKLKTQITKGNYNTGRLLKINEKNRVLYFLGNAKEPDKNPYYHHLYSIEFNGDNLSLLTPENAEHEIYFSDTGDYFVDNYSRADLPPKTVVRNSTGKMIMELEDADITSLEKEGWKKPEVFHVKAADGCTDIWGVMFKPYDFDSGKKYPIITYGYPGKESEFLPWRFCHNAWVGACANSLAQYGFIVIVAGNRGGSPERSYSYYNFGEDNFRDYPIADKKVVVERLAEKYSFIDINRVGIMGQSSGGFMAASAILLEPDFFKVAVVKSGPQNPALYYHHWYERYSNVIDTKDNITSRESNNIIVDKLKGRLLLVQGDMDYHVPPSLTYRFAYDLMMANKRFDMFIIPKADHFWGDNYPYVIKYMELYFVEHLMGDKTFNCIEMFDKY